MKQILIPFGAVGLLFVICIFAIQFKAFVRLFYSKNTSNTVYLDSFFLSSCVFFLFSSLSHIIWLYIIFYRVFLYRSMENQKIWNKIEIIEFSDFEMPISEIKYQGFIY